MNVTIDEGTVLLVMAAFRLGLGDATAKCPDDLLRRCIDFLEADGDQAAQAVVDRMQEPQA